MLCKIKLKPFLSLALEQLIKNNCLLLNKNVQYKVKRRTYLKIKLITHLVHQYDAIC